ncbi:MAG: hypothetical protein SF028_03025 [Candidatus Sumerlaeia bacterium]|nr:hypothetical protein [Candidatus Sumerlaeia bacterium]
MTFRNLAATAAALLVAAAAHAQTEPARETRYIPAVPDIPATTPRYESAIIPIAAARPTPTPFAPGGVSSGSGYGFISPLRGEQSFAPVVEGLTLALRRLASVPLELAGAEAEGYEAQANEIVRRSPKARLLVHVRDAEEAELFLRGAKAVERDMVVLSEVEPGMLPEGVRAIHLDEAQLVDAAVKDAATDFPPAAHDLWIIGTGVDPVEAAQERAKGLFTAESADSRQPKVLTTMVNPAGSPDAMMAWLAPAKALEKPAVVLLPGVPVLPVRRALRKMGLEPATVIAVGDSSEIALALDKGDINTRVRLHYDELVRMALAEFARVEPSAEATPLPIAIDDTTRKGRR